MNKIILIVSLFIFAMQLHAQNYEFKLPCEDVAETQAEMNICSSVKSKMIDSLVNARYNCFKRVLENDFKQSILMKDTAQANHYKNLGEAFDASQKSYTVVAKANRLVYNNMYEGGSIRNMMVNYSSIADGIDRLKKLDIFFQDYTGDNKICK